MATNELPEAAFEENNRIDTITSGEGSMGKIFLLLWRLTFG